MQSLKNRQVCDDENTTAIGFGRERLEAISGRCGHTLEVLNNFFNNDFSMCAVAGKRGEIGGGVRNLRGETRGRGDSRVAVFAIDGCEGGRGNRRANRGSGGLRKTHEH